MTAAGQDRTGRQARTGGQARMGGQVGTGGRRALAAFVFLALLLKLMVPAGYMPGTSLSVPILLCPEQGPMPSAPVLHHAAVLHHAGGVVHDGGEAPAKRPHGADHPCAFAGVATAALVAPLDLSAHVPVTIAARAGTAAPSPVRVPGHGLAAPPPPSHAPPASRA